MGRQVHIFGLAAAALPLMGTVAIAYRQTTVPNLYKLTSAGFPNASHTCTINGNGAPGSKQAHRNRQKNRYRLPSTFVPKTFGDIAAMPPVEKFTNKAVEVKVWVDKVDFGGISHGESCNCSSQDKKLVDIHIDCLSAPDADKTHKIVAEVTVRSRMLAQAGLLTSNVGNDWSKAKLKSQLEGHWVTFKGYLFYDPDHSSGAWDNDPTDDKNDANHHGETNWRDTCWEIHPVLGITVQ